MKVLLCLLIACSIIFSVAEKLVKIEGTSGEFSDIVIDSENRWYIIKNKILYSSLDKGKTLNKIELPSKEFVFSGLGIDIFNNIYVQDNKLSVFIVAPTVEEGKFVSEEISLAYGKEKLVSRPFSRYISNKVYFATKSGLMDLKNGALICRPFATAPGTNGSITNVVPYEYYGENMFYSGGNPRHWVYFKETLSETPILQTKSFVKYMNDGYEHTFFIVNGEDKIRIIKNRRNPQILQEVDASYIDDNQIDFVTYSRSLSKIYLFNNINDTGKIYELGEKKINGVYEIQVASTILLKSNIRILCSARTREKNNEIYFGTSDGIYQLADLTPKLRRY